MKLLRVIATAVVVLSAALAMGQSDAQKSFERLMSLAGAWQGKTQDGKPVKVSYRVTSNGSALLSEIAEPEGMITMFHLGGGRLLMTHYRRRQPAAPAGDRVVRWKDDHVQFCRRH